MKITEKLKKAVWEKGIVVPDYDSKRYRKDACGAWMAWDRFNDKHSPYGWQIDHIYPAEKLLLKRLTQSRIDDLLNLRPMHWKNNHAKGIDYPTYRAVIKAVDNHNEHIDDTFEIKTDDQLRLRELYGV